MSSYVFFKCLPRSQCMECVILGWFTWWQRHCACTDIASGIVNEFHQSLDCLCKSLCKLKTKTPSNFCITGPKCYESTGYWWVPAQMACNVENIPVLWQNHVVVTWMTSIISLATVFLVQGTIVDPVEIHLHYMSFIMPYMVQSCGSEINSLASGRCGCNLKSLFFKLI